MRAGRARTRVARAATACGRAGSPRRVPARAPSRAGPWEIPIAALVGGYAFQWWDGVCERSEEKVEAVRAKRFEANEAVVPQPKPAPVPKY